MRPWTLAAWCALTIGIAMGSWWAYYTLGWGGWWFWDPVENASFMPWLVGTALLHSAVVVEKRDALKTWTMLLAILAFSLSLLGTFLVRSGVLTSVHAFASDPRRGVFILLLLSLYTGGALLLFAWRAPQLQGGGLFAPISREGGLLLNNLLLTTAAATVLLGTLYPLFLDVVAGQKVSVGPPFFNMTFVPIMVPLLVAMGVGPMLPWKRGDLLAALARLKLAFAMTAAVGAARAGRDRRAIGRRGVQGWRWRPGCLPRRWPSWRSASACSTEPLRERLAPGAAPAARRLGHDAGACRDGGRDRRDRRLVCPGPRRRSSAPGPANPSISPATRSRSTRSSRSAAPTTPRSGPTCGCCATGARSPRCTRKRRTVANGTATHVAIRTNLLSDVYAVIGEADGDGAYVLRLYHNPLVPWIWLGAVVDGVGRAGLAVRPAPPDRRPGAAGAAGRGRGSGPGGRMTAIRAMMRRGWLYLLPAALFALLAVGFYAGLGSDTTVLPSALIDQPAPEFALPPLTGGGAGFSSADLHGTGEPGQRLRLVVRALPRRAPGAERAGAIEAGADLRHQLQGQARGGAGLDRRTRQSLHADRRR